MGGTSFILACIQESSGDIICKSFMTMYMVRHYLY